MKHPSNNTSHESHHDDEADEGAADVDDVGPPNSGCSTRSILFISMSSSLSLAPIAAEQKQQQQRMNAPSQTRKKSHEEQRRHALQFGRHRGNSLHNCNDALHHFFGHKFGFERSCKHADDVRQIDVAFTESLLVISERNQKPTRNQEITINTNEIFKCKSDQLTPTITAMR